MTGLLFGAFARLALGRNTFLLLARLLDHTLASAALILGKTMRRR
jgi:hypothetical protein